MFWNVTSALFKDSMQIPFAGLSDAEEPEPAALRVRGIKVIAGFVPARPPGAADPLGADGVGDGVHFALMCK